MVKTFVPAAIMLTLTHLLLLGLGLFLGSGLPTALLALPGPGYNESADIYLLDLDRRLAHDATRSRDREILWALSEDQRQLLVIVVPMSPDQIAWLLDWPSRQSQSLPFRQPYLISINDIVWNGDTILYTAMMREEYQVFRFDLTTQTADTVFASRQPVTNIALSPDDRWLIYNIFNDQLHSDTYAIAADCEVDCPTHRITGQSGSEEQVIWSPDGKQIAFISIIETTRIYSLLSDCLYDAGQEDRCQYQNARRFDTGDVVPVGRPFVWSADGTALIFRGVRAGREGIYRMPSDCFADPAGCKPELIYDMSALPYLGKR